MTIAELIAAIQINVDNYKQIIENPDSDPDHVERLKRVVAGYEEDLRELRAM